MFEYQMVEYQVVLPWLHMRKCVCGCSYWEAKGHWGNKAAYAWSRWRVLAAIKATWAIVLFKRWDVIARTGGKPAGLKHRSGRRWEAGSDGK